MKFLKKLLSITLITGILAGFAIQPALAAILVTRVADIYNGAGSSSPRELAVYNAALYFTALGNDGTGRHATPSGHAPPWPDLPSNTWKIMPS